MAVQFQYLAVDVLKLVGLLLVVRDSCLLMSSVGFIY